MTIAETRNGAAASVAAAHDPLFAAIARLHAGEAMIEAMPVEDFDRYGGEEAALETLFHRHHRAISGWRGPAKSREGAIAALNLAQREASFCGDNPAAIAMIQAVIGFLEGQRTATRP